jgi:hypothetical protein
MRKLGVDCVGPDEKDPARRSDFRHADNGAEYSVLSLCHRLKSDDRLTMGMIPNDYRERAGLRKRGCRAWPKPR